MANVADTRVDQAIADSVRENRSVILTAKLDTQEWTDLAAALSARCDDYSEETTETGERRDYWGTDDDGDAWRVKLDTVEA